jgi:hypothetical protein
MMLYDSSAVIMASMGYCPGVVADVFDFCHASCTMATRTGHRGLYAVWVLSALPVAEQLAHLYIVWGHVLPTRWGQSGQLWRSVEWGPAQMAHVGPWVEVHTAWWWPNSRQRRHWSVGLDE